MGLLLVVFLVDLEHVITQVISRNTGNQSQLIWIGGMLDIQQLNFNKFQIQQ